MYWTNHIKENHYESCIAFFYLSFLSRICVSIVDIKFYIFSSATTVSLFHYRAILECVLNCSLFAPIIPSTNISQYYTNVIVWMWLCFVLFEMLIDLTCRWTMRVCCVHHLMEKEKYLHRVFSYSRYWFATIQVFGSHYIIWLKFIVTRN